MQRITDVRQMSDGIARRSPLESGPVGEARQSYNGFIKDTWGGYASRLVEHWGELGVDLTLQDACDLLGIAPEDIRNDDSVQFQKQDDAFDYDAYETMLHRKWQKEAEALYTPLVDELRSKVDSIAARFRVDHSVDGTAEAERIQKEIDERTHSEEYLQLESELRKLSSEREKAFENSMLAPEETSENAKAAFEDVKKQHEVAAVQFGVLEDSISLLCAKRDAFESGTVLTLDAFLEAMYTVDLSDNQCASAWGKAFEDCVYHVINETFYGDTVESIKVRDVYVGADLFDEFKFNISQHTLVQSYIQEKSDFIQPAFFTTVTARNHPLFTGIDEK